MDAMPWEDLCRITLKKSIMASSPWLEHRFTHTRVGSTDSDCPKSHIVGESEGRRRGGATVRRNINFACPVPKQGILGNKGTLGTTIFPSVFRDHWYLRNSNLVDVRNFNCFLSIFLDFHYSYFLILHIVSQWSTLAACLATPGHS